MIRCKDPIEPIFSGTSLVVVAVACALALIAPSAVMVPKPKPPEPFVVALQAPPPEPEVKPETPPPPKPQNKPVPKPVQKPLHVPKPITPPLPQPAPAAEPPPPPQKPTAVAPVTPPLPTLPPAPASAPQPSSANAENTYISRLRNYIRSITEYPTSGDARRTRPEGSTVVRFVLSRQGQLKNAQVEHSSGSQILDKKAISIVQDGSYPAMPKEVWPDEAEHSFTVTVEFVAP